MASIVPSVWLSKGAIVVIIASQRCIPAPVTVGLKLQSTPSPTVLSLEFAGMVQGKHKEGIL